MLLLRVSPRVEYAITIDIHILANYLQILNVYLPLSRKLCKCWLLKRIEKFLDRHVNRHHFRVAAQPFQWLNCRAH